MKFHTAALGQGQKRVLELLGPELQDTTFYLAGGTALALQLGHRRSIDLDWFTARAFHAPRKMASSLETKLGLQTNQIDEGTLLGRIGRVPVSFFEQPVPFLKPLVRFPDMNCRLASLADLAAMKIAAIGGRGAKKDFVDIHALGQTGVSLTQMIAWFQKKFSVQDMYHTLNSLSYFEDADRQPMPRMLQPTTWRGIKETIRSWVKQL